MTILKNSLNLYENCRDTETGSSVHNLAMLYDLGALFTFLQYWAISAESYSAQLNVMKSVGEPYSAIIALTSPFTRNQY